jgi:2-haloacid dehalogenase
MLPYMAAPRALFFDVFGTLVDWRSGISRDAKGVLGALGVELDWLAFADAWRAEYEPALEQVRSGRTPFCKLDVLHRQNLERILPRWGVALPPEAALDTLSRAWHRLDAWPDVAAGLARLAPHFWLAPVSNGNISLQVALARRNGFPWSAVLGAELARDYKPSPAVYEHACAAFDLPPAECMMVAAHSSDLRAAARQGLRTAFVARPAEYGPDHPREAAEAGVDLTTESLEDLARQLGV